jgi:CDP-4-dehydro-6-deoxyglucose reductase
MPSAAPAQPFEARLIRAQPLAPGVRELLFERVDGRPMTFVAGQWVSALLDTSDALGVMKRSYSIASAPDDSPRFEIAVTRVKDGPGSNLLHALEPGAVLPFVGPQGFFTRPKGARALPSLMIATGTGVTPMRSMLRAAVASGERAPIWLILGVRYEEDLLYGDELRALAREHTFFRFEPTLSRPHGTWSGRRGYVQTHTRALWEELVAHGDGVAHAYVCGLERMVGSVRELLRKEMAVPRQQVHSERYD